MNGMNVTGSQIYSHVTNQREKKDLLCGCTYDKALRFQLYVNLLDIKLLRGLGQGRLCVFIFCVLYGGILVHGDHFLTGWEETA